MGLEIKIESLEGLKFEGESKEYNNKVGGFTLNINGYNDGLFTGGGSDRYGYFYVVGMMRKGEFEFVKVSAIGNILHYKANELKVNPASSQNPIFEGEYSFIKGPSGTGPWRMWSIPKSE